MMKPSPELLANIGYKTKPNSEHVQPITQKLKKMTAVIKHKQFLRSMSHSDVSSDELF